MREETKRYATAVAAMAVLTPALLFASLVFEGSGVLGSGPIAVSTWAVGAAPSALLAHWFVRRHPRPRLALSLGTIGLVIGSTIGALSAWHEPIIRHSFDTCGTGAVMALFAAFPAVALLAVTSFGFSWVVAQDDRWIPKALPFMAALAFVGVAASTVHGARLWSTRPGVDQWLEAVVGHEGAVVPAAMVDGRVERVSVSDGLSLYRVCTTQEEMWPECRISLSSTESDALDEATILAHGTEVGRNPLSAFHDPRTGYTIVDLLPSGEIEYTPRRFAFDERGEPAAVRPADLSAVIAPPLPWLAAGAIGLLLAALAMVRARILGRRGRRLSLGREGRVDGDAIIFDDGELPSRGRLFGDLPDGPAVAFRGSDPHALSYRDDGKRGGWTGLRGTRAELREDLELRAAASYAFALASLGCCAAPMVVALRSLT